MPLKILVIADDLTGANDVGVQFAKKGIPSFVTMDLGGNFKEHFGKFDVVVVDSESRHIQPIEAGSRIFALVSRTRQTGIRHFYKKTDSTMRGNVGSELEAMLRASGESTLCFVPALPQLKRITRNGIQYVQGVPLHETAFAHDARNPMSESRVELILAQQSAAPTRVVARSELVKFRQSPPPAGIVIFDAEDESDLRKAGEAIRHRGCLRVLAGTAGFAECLPELLEFRKSERACPKYRFPILAINGSLNEVSLQQVTHAETSRFVSKRMPPEILISRDGADSFLIESFVREAGELLSRGRDVLLRSVSHRDELRSFTANAAHSHHSTFELHERVARNTGRLVGRILERSKVRLLLVSGGDTLVGIAGEQRWPGFIPREELLPGVTVSEVAGENQLLVISKAGGFGAEDVFTKIWEILKERAKC